MVEQSAAEQLLALELAREERRKRRNRVIAWLAVVAAVAAVVFFGFVKPAQDRAAEHDRQVDIYFCQMTGGEDCYDD